MRVLAIDQGTSATKAVVVDDGIVAGEATSPCAPVTTTDGGVEVEPELLWSSVVAAGEAALAAAGGASPDAIGLANQGETVLAWDRRTGTPFGAAIVWQDRRSLPICAKLRRAGWDVRLGEITGLELDPYFVAPKIAFLRERVEPGATITTTDTWLVHRLCGAFVTDAATASRSLLLDLDAVVWSEEACEAFDLDPDALPTIVDNAGVVGESTTFTSRPVPVAGLCVDQQAALFAESCVDAGQAKCTYGTGAFLLASTGAQPTRSRHGLVGCVAWRIGDVATWCLDGQVYTVGSAVSWLESIGLIDHASDLDALGATVSSPDGVVFVPGLAGLGAPFWAPDAKGSITGISLGTTRAHIVRAVVEGIAAQVAFLAQAAEADLGTPISRLRVDGGLTRSEVLLQVQADLLQAPVEVYPSPHATALGIAEFARLGAGDPEPAVEWQPARVVEPAVSADEAEHRLSVWRMAAESSLSRHG